MRMGPELGRYFAQQFAMLIIAAFIVGGIVFLGGWWLASFLIEHITIGWR